MRMLRLLRGDVGSGKTVVALLAAAAVVEAGKQAALMAPTEILARHIKTNHAAGRRASLRCDLTGRGKGKGAADPGRGWKRARSIFWSAPCADPGRRDLQGAGAGRGRRTRRFGVRERLALTNKGETVDVLVLSATPSALVLILWRHGRLELRENRPAASRSKTAPSR